MTRSLVAVGGAATLVAGLTSGILGAAPPPDGQYVKVEIRGQLLSGAEGAGQRPDTLSINSGGMTFALEFKDHPPSPEKLRDLSNQTVVVRGTLRKEGRDRLVCVVEGELEGSTQRGRSAQYLVGYVEGQHSILESFCRELGLEVVEHYQPGKYLVVEPTEKADARFIDRLKESKAVRYIEKNQEYRIPEKKG